MKLSEQENSLIKKMLSGDRFALSRLISITENNRTKAPKIQQEINSRTGNAYVVGITGPPGAGKSTLINCIAKRYREAQKKVGIIAVDPTSPFSGGAVLGDRIRMQDHSIDDNVFIRSLGSRGSRGGLSVSTREIVKLYDAFGFDIIIIETVGVGQTEFDIISIADTVMVVMVPESGDIIQTMKAGLMEIADIFIVNKADREGADKLSKHIMSMTSHAGNTNQWGISVLTTSAINEKGIEDVIELIENHKEFQIKHNLLAKKRQNHREQELIRIIDDLIHTRIYQKKNKRDEDIKDIIKRVKKGKLDPYEGAEHIVSGLLKHQSDMEK